MANVISRESMQAFRLELIQHVQEGLPVEEQLAQVERSLLANVGHSVASGEFATSVEVKPACQTCHGSGWEHITHRIRHRYVDSAVRCTDCDGRGQIAA